VREGFWQEGKRISWKDEQGSQPTNNLPQEIKGSDM
jgi:hypothetical protein